jgi:hypothetical protein
MSAKVPKRTIGEKNMARQKQVFKSNQEITHVWAQQVQESGRAGNIYFQNFTDLYSYGPHYLAAKIHTVKGKRVALLRSDSYSPTTSQHLSYAASAVRGLMPYFYAKDVTNLKAASLELDQVAQDRIGLALKRSKVTDKGSIKYEFESIREVFKTANELRKIIGKAEIWPTKKQLDQVQKHLEARLKRYQELNTPEALAKKAAAKAKRDARKEALALEKQAEQIEKFRAGKSSRVDGIGYELLRIDGNELVTSRGARVPLPDAKRLLMAINNGKDVAGATIGHYSINGIEEYTNGEKAVVIGCHKIRLSEANRVLSA